MEDGRSSCYQPGGKGSIGNRIFANDAISAAKAEKLMRSSEKKKMIKARNEIVTDLPSDLSDDEWGEVQRYGQILHQD